ncbi:hypothetical protein EJB05_02367, partial [Eragrostis curvula]
MGTLNFSCISNYSINFQSEDQDAVHVSVGDHSHPEATDFHVHCGNFGVLGVEAWLTVTEDSLFLIDCTLSVDMVVTNNCTHKQENRPFRIHVGADMMLQVVCYLNVD